MYVVTKEFFEAISKIQDIIGDIKGSVGIMFDSTGEQLGIHFATNNKAAVEKIAVVYGENDIKGNMCVSYEMLMSAINTLKPSGNIVVDSLEFSFGDDGIFTITARPTFVVNYTDEDGESVRKERPMGSKCMSMLWQSANSSNRTAILSRTDYSRIFNDGEDEETNEWDIEVLKESLMKTSQERKKIIYFSPHNQRAFVCNTAYMSSAYIAPVEGLDGEEEPAFTIKFMLSSDVAKNLASYLGKLSATDNTVTLKVIDNRFLCVRNSDCTSGLWVELAGAVGSHVNTFSSYNSYNYDLMQTMFMREFLQDIIKSALSSTTADKTEFSFVKSPESESYKLVMSCKNNASQTTSEFEIACDNMVCREGITPDKIKVTMALKVFNDMLSQLVGDLVGFDLNLNADGSYALRLSEIDLENMMDMIDEKRDELGLGENESMPVECQFELRDKMIKSSMYTMCSK